MMQNIPVVCAHQHPAHVYTAKTHMRNATTHTVNREGWGSSFFVACSILCLPVGGAFAAQQDAECVKLNHITIRHYVRPSMMIIHHAGPTVVPKMNDGFTVQTQLITQLVFMIPLLLKCVYACKTAHKGHFSVQIHLVL